MPGGEKINKINSRALQNVDVKVDAEKRTMEFPFSSELPVERWFGNEILSHKSGAANFERLNGGAQLLFNHDMDRYIGIIEKAWMGEDQRGHVRVRFSKNQDAEQIMKDVEDGILRNVSFGYMIDEFDEPQASTKGEMPTYTATKWSPFEVSIVTVPADPTVGVGRSMIETVDELEALIKRSAPPEKTIEIENAGDHLPAEINQGEKMSELEIRAEAVRSERERVAAISALCEKHGQKELARELINGDKSVDEARAAVLERIGAAQKPVNTDAGVVGLTEKEVRSFSFRKAILAQMHPSDRKIQDEARFEKEVSLAAQDKAGKTARGFMVPVDVLRSKRDLSVGTSTAGGNLVSTDLLASSFIDLLRNKSALQQAGAMVMNGLTGNIAIPRMTGGATAYWVAESAAPTESAQAFDQVAMSPKTLGAYTDYSRKLMLQSSVDVESIIRDDLAKVIALAIDLAGLYGTGSSNQPLGLKNVTGLNTSDFAANIPTWAEIVGLETLVSAANADVASMKYIMNASGRGSLKTTVKASNTGLFMYENGGVNGYPAVISNQVAANDFWFGVWSDLMIGFWSGLDILVDPYTASTTGTVRVVALQDCDVAVRHAVSFARGNNTL
jgi:HK97 family phage major capsid protein/HK97 family phage prohead protease